MKRKAPTRYASLFLSLAFVLLHADFRTTAAPVAPQPTAAEGSNSIGVNGFFSIDRAQRGSTFQAAILMEIPGGLHVNANKPLGKYAVPTIVKVEAPRGFRVTPVVYPRGTARNLQFSPGERLAVYEGRAVMRFNVTVPADAEMGVKNVRVNVRFQSCSDEVCFPPATRELSLAIAIVGANEPVQHVNGQLFGGGGRRRR